MRAEILIFVLTLSLAVAKNVHRRPQNSSIQVLIDRRFEYTGYEDSSVYYVELSSFKDSDGDGIGDIQGLISKLDHLTEINVDAVRLGVIFPNTMDDYGYDIRDYRAINPIFGTSKDFDELATECKRRNLKLYLDWVPNHMSTKSACFKKSLAGDKTYSDYFIWRKGTVLEDGSMAPPNNWLCVHGGSAWTYREERKAYYYHQFGPEQPDLNYYHHGVVEEMNSAMKFWYSKGVDGFSISGASYLAEHKELLDEPLSDHIKDPELYDYTKKVYTRNQEQSYELIKGWKKIADGYKPARQLIIDTHVNVSLAMKYYDYGARYPLNYELISDVEKRWSASEHLKIVHNWMENKPESCPPSWVTGYPGNKRLVTTFGPQRARCVLALSMLLPGVSMIHSGDEIGMEDLEELQGDEPAAHIPEFLRNKHTSKSHGQHGHDENESDDDASDSSQSSEFFLSDTPKRITSDSVWNVNRIGRSPYLWDDSPSAGFSTNPEPWCPIHDRYKEVNLAIQKKDNNTFYSYYQAVSILKKSSNFKKSCLVTKQLHRDVLAFSRETETNGKAYVLINYAKEERRVDMSSFTGLPRQTTVYYSSEGCEMNQGTVISDHKHIHLPQYGTVILLSKGHKFFSHQ